MIVVEVVAVTARTALAAGSVARGYAVGRSLPSFVQVNVIDPVAREILEEVVRL